MKRELDWWIPPVVLIVAITLVLIILKTKQINKYNIELCNNTPNINYIEEDLEDTFMTTFVQVIEISEENCAQTVYIVKANGIYYKVEYVCEYRNGCSPFDLKEWFMNRYIQIEYKGD